MIEEPLTTDDVKRLTYLKIGGTSCMKSRMGNSLEDGGIHRQLVVVLRCGQIMLQKEID